jgi:hypothetical protein
MITGRDEKRAKEVVDQIKKDGGEASYVIAGHLQTAVTGQIS